MAGELWSQLHALVRQVDTGRLAAAGQDWGRLQRILSLAHQDFDSLAGRAFDTGLDAEVAEPLLLTVRGTARALTAASAELGDTSAGGSAGGGPASTFYYLRDYVEDLRDRMAADETGKAMRASFYGPPVTHGTAYPHILSEDPDMRLLHEYQRGVFDLQAQVYLERLQGSLQAAVGWLQQTSLEWPADLPQADPSADPPPLGR